MGRLISRTSLGGGGGNRTRVEPRLTSLGNDQKWPSTRSFVLTVRDRDYPLMTPILCPARVKCVRRVSWNGAVGGACSI
jgi:hypothetical protein